MPILLADCDAFLQLPPHIEDVEIQRPPTASFEWTEAESTNFDLALVIEQRDIEDEAALNRFMQEVLRSRKPAEAWLDPKQPLPPEAQAQRLVFEAGRSNGRKRFKLARRALALWPDCADAYLILLEETLTPAETLPLLQDALAAGERAMKSHYDPDEIERLLREAEDAGPIRDDRPLTEDDVIPDEDEPEIEFWVQPATRPYQRVRGQLAFSLKVGGEVAAALDHYRALLRLCPRDNQGIRYLLAAALLEMMPGDAAAGDELGALLRRYDVDDSAHWAYNRALWLYHRVGKEAATPALREAIESNYYFPALLAGLEKSTFDYDSLAPGTLEEATDYLVLGLDAWTANDDTALWLMEHFSKAVHALAEEHGIDLDDEDDEDDALPPGSGPGFHRLH